VSHRFQYRLYMAYLDLAELPDLLRRNPGEELWVLLFLVEHWHEPVLEAQLADRNVTIELSSADDRVRLG